MASIAFRGSVSASGGSAASLLSAGLLLAAMLGAVGCPSSGKPSVMSGEQDTDVVSQDDGWSMQGDNAVPQHGGEISLEDAAVPVGDAEVLPDGLTDGADGGASVPFGGCCFADEECGEGAVCIGGTEAEPGICAVAAPEGNGCYSDENCGDSKVCFGAAWCRCDEYCLIPAIPGFCIPAVEGCCVVDKDCLENERCSAGNCLEQPAPGGCWIDDDCQDAEICIGASICPCGYVCPDPSEPGICVPLQPECCDSNADCVDGLVCIKAMASQQGQCKIPPPDGDCYSTVDCPAEGFCVDSQVCPCGVPCDWHPGHCESCCQADEDCSDGMKCVAGNCENAASSPRCWDSQDCPDPSDCSGEDCPDAYVCLNVTVCSCGNVCGYEAELGWCVPQNGDEKCCISSADCWDNTICVVGYCLESATDGACWFTADCPAGQECIGAEIVACGQPPLPDFVAKLGWCGGYIPCCASDDDCPSGFVCAGADSDSGILGMCKQKTEAKNTCWTDSECAEDKSCQGSYACACGESCGPEIPGVCETQPEQVCCWGDDDCDGNLVCVGAIPDEQEGRCGEQAPQGNCWKDSDCGGGYCDGQVVCGCEQSCSPEPGICVAGQECCESDYECNEPGARCIFGVCKAPVPFGACWDDEDCPQPGASDCLGAFVCPCNEWCSQPDEPGVCSPLMSGECCSLPEHCNEGEECLFPDGPSELGKCYYPTEYPECWQENDCEGGAICWKAHICGCDAPGCVPAKGLCLAFGQCCSQDDDCAGNMKCVPTPGGLTGDGVCKQQAQGNYCWHDGNCDEGLPCSGVFVCPCGAICDTEDTVGLCGLD